MRLIVMLMAAALLAGCASKPPPRIEVRNRYICTPVKRYAPETMARARAEMAAHCETMATVCAMMGDYLASRDASRRCAAGLVATMDGLKGQ